jgi:hypothetical protein
MSTRIKTRVKIRVKITVRIRVKIRVRIRVRSRVRVRTIDQYISVTCSGYQTIISISWTDGWTDSSTGERGDC